jgi:hypothetical protein
MVWVLERRSSSSMLKRVARFFYSAVVLLVVLVGVAPRGFAADESLPPKASDTFFAGTVTEATAEKVTVGRTVRGKAESRTFRMTPETKVEGQMAAQVRVTVRYVTDDDGDTAILIVVRPAVAARPGKQKN